MRGVNLFQLCPWGFWFSIMNPSSCQDALSSSYPESVHDSVVWLGPLPFLGFSPNTLNYPGLSGLLLVTPLDLGTRNCNTHVSGSGKCLFVYQSSVWGKLHFYIVWSTMAILIMEVMNFNWIVCLFFIVGVQRDAEENEAFEQVDEDIAVTQSQMNFICPITQVSDTCWHQNRLICCFIGCFKL